MGSETDDRRPASAVDPLSWDWESRADYLKYYRLIGGDTPKCTIPFELIIEMCRKHPDLIDDLDLPVRRAALYVINFGTPPKLGSGWHYDPLTNTAINNISGKKVSLDEEIGQE